MNMLKRTYRSEDRMRDLFEDNSLLLMALSRFGISLGFGNSSVEDVCRRYSVDCQTFLAIANFISGYECADYRVDLHSLMDYLKRAHQYFLEFQLPAIRRKLLSAIDCSRDDDMSLTIVQFFDDYVGEVRRHMEYENTKVFTYVDNILQGQRNPNFSIDYFASHHDAIDKKLNDLKETLVRHYPKFGGDILNSALFDIINCQQDLVSHCEVEDRLFVPAVKEAEMLVAAEDETNKESSAETSQNMTLNSDAEKIAVLGEREKEIIACVARGLSNKEIADRLCISVHTVSTHRRNISAKLNIHSAAGITIFAILNGIISVNDVDL